MTSRLLLFIASLSVIGCATTQQKAAPAAATAQAVRSDDELAREYVRLVLAMGQHDADYVDAFYGPQEWAEEVKAKPLPLDEIAARAEAVSVALASAEAKEELQKMRHAYLRRQLEALRARVRMLKGERLGFDEESQALYDATSPARSEADFEQVLQALEQALPGDAPLPQRLEAFRQTFTIPREKLDAVFQAAIAESRRRTVEKVKLPANERFILEYVTGKSWGGYNWYKGNATSLIQINTDIPIHPWRAIDLAAHEGYPGHHVYNVLLEQHLVNDRGWVEFSVYALFSPQSLIAEGTANYGIEVAFPDAAKFAQEVLFPLAGLDPARADEYIRVEKLVSKLDFASNEAARGYLDGKLTREQARDWLVRYSLMSPERAEKRMAFIDTYRTYVINYNVGRELVRSYVERRVGKDATAERRWEVFVDLLSSPRLPSDLR